jgi:FMN-dependent NADH-azoreductase
MTKILRIDASARHMDSTTRNLADRLITKLETGAGGTHVVVRDLALSPPPLLTQDWVHANFTDETARSSEQQAALHTSDILIAELEAADTIVIAAPIYNFGIPAALKAWVDMIARARKTFRYTEKGPVGLLTGKKAYIVMASGGTAIGSEIDFASGYLRHVLGFVGITNVQIVAADQLMVDADVALAKAGTDIENILLAA